MMTKITKHAWQLPWQGDQVPHALVDVNRQCNLSCRSCYNSVNWQSKSLAEIKTEVETLLSLRKLDSVSIVGGEPTLHQDLLKIIEYVTARGLHSEIFTNGLLLDDSLATKLQQAGLGLAFLHIQSDQDRPDLDLNKRQQSMEKLLDKKSAILKKHGIEVGLSYTAHANRMDELLWLVNYTLKNPAVGYMVVTMDTDIKNMAPIRGDIFQGMEAVDNAVENDFLSNRVSIIEMAEHISYANNFIPFCYLGANIDTSLPRWVSFMTLCAYDGKKLKDQLSLKASYLEKGYFHLQHLLKGKYPFHGNAEKELRFQLILNSLLGGRFFRNGNFLGKILRYNYAIKAKKILLQAPAYIGDDGKVVHCAHCPDAVLKNGRMVPACISDRVTN